LSRAIAAEALGGGGPVKPDPAWAGPLLVEAFRDNYPVVRFFAANGLANIGLKVAKPDYLASPDARDRAANQWRYLFLPEARDRAASLADTFRHRRVDVDIRVGE